VTWRPLPVGKPSSNGPGLRRAIMCFEFPPECRSPGLSGIRAGAGRAWSKVVLELLMTTNRYASDCPAIGGNSPSRQQSYMPRREVEHRSRSGTSPTAGWLM